ncbi:hypothetical protein N0V82_000403 [Gnomoniopsis sp. IMI 355080]|nr:hypothetical protein N0V82_000403 [Gnomoniopsis sp. IMI 355080]
MGTEEQQVTAETTLPRQYLQAGGEAEDSRQLRMNLPTGPPPTRGGTRTISARGGGGGGWDNSIRQGAGGFAQGSARGAAAAYEASRRQRAAEEKARIQAGRQNQQTQKREVASSSSEIQQNRGLIGPSVDVGGPAAGHSTNTRGTQLPKEDGKALPPIPKDGDKDKHGVPHSSTDPSKHNQRAGTPLPVDLPTTYYEAVRLADAPSTYIDYPARIHHLKYPTEVFTPSVGHKWEDIHLHQKVSSPRLHTRWTRPATATDTERSRDFFVRFHATGYEPFMGFRPYTDILFLDGQYMAAAVLGGRRSRHRRHGSAPTTPDETDADSLVPFLTAADRVKVRILAVAASAFGSTKEERAQVCAALVRAFPALVRVFLVSVAPVPRPSSAAWVLETEFARWIKVSHATRAQARKTEEVVGSVGAYGVKHGLVEEEEENEEGGCSGNPLAEEIEAAFVLARESGRRTAENRAQAEQDLEKEREPVDWDKVDYSKMLAPRTSTSDRSSGSSRSSGVTRKIKVEAYIMLYFQDAYDRAVSKGLSEEFDRISVDHLDLAIL